MVICLISNSKQNAGVGKISSNRRHYSMPVPRACMETWEWGYGDMGRGCGDVGVGVWAKLCSTDL